MSPHEKYLVMMVDLVVEIRRKTLNNLNFNPSDWSWHDGDTLEQAGKFIKREVKRYEKIKKLEPQREGEKP